MTELLDRDLTPVLDSIGRTLGDTVRAALDNDREAARRVLRTGNQRRALLEAASDASGLNSALSGEERRSAANALLLVSDLAGISRLIDHLARMVAVGGCDLTDDEHEALLLLARYGEERLHQLASGPTGPGMSREFTRCGDCLFEVLARLDDGRVSTVPGRPAVACCAAMTARILRASRHALRAA